MALPSLAVSILVAMGASGGDVLSPSPQPGPPIRVVSNTYEIDFPNEVVFTLEAEANAEITGVTLFYRLGRQEVTIYGYPDFAPATHVTADFEIKTGGTNYLPSGVDIGYHYVIRDAAGNSFETETFHLEYKDSAFRWQRLRQENLVVLWHDRPIDEVAEVATYVNRRLQAVTELLGPDAASPMKAVILNSILEADQSFPLVSDAARRRHIYGGFAFGALDVFVLVGLNGDGMVHEMTHLMIDEAVDSPRARVPAWLNEGLAMYFESSSHGRAATLSRVARDRLLPLRSMSNQPGRPEDVRLFYAQSRSIVNHMMQTYGQERMAALLSSINGGASIEKAIQEAYGMGLEELEREWKGQVFADAWRAPWVDPGTSGTAFLLAGAVAVAVAAMVVRWLRHTVSSPDSGDTEQ